VAWDGEPPQLGEMRRETLVTGRLMAIDKFGQSSFSLRLIEIRVDEHNTKEIILPRKTVLNSGKGASNRKTNRSKQLFC
jgi:hypothetical protein